MGRKACYRLGMRYLPPFRLLGRGSARMPASRGVASLPISCKTRILQDVAGLLLFDGTAPALSRVLAGLTSEHVP